VREAPAFPAVPTVVMSKTEPFALPPGTPADLGSAIERVWPQG
jgi:hypothetical protein